MLAIHQTKLDLFLENFHDMKSYMPLRLGFSKALAAFMFASQDRKVEIESIERVKQKLDAIAYKKTEFRHAAELYLWTELALSGKEDELIELANLAYNTLRQQGITDPWVNAYIALQMAEYLDVSEFEQHVKRLVVYRATLRINHKLRVGRHSTVLASMLLLTGIEPDLVLGRIEHAYALMKEHCPQRLRNYTAAIVLALAEDVEVQVRRFAKLGNICKKHGIAVFNRFSINSLALLSFLPLDDEWIGEVLFEMSTYLRTTKDFSALYAPKHTVAILTSSILLLGFYDSQREKGEDLGTHLNLEQLEIAERSVLAAADDLMRRAESSQAG